MRWLTVPASPYKGGYSKFVLREDVAPSYLSLFTLATALGGIIPSSGSRRSPDKVASANQSQTSNHLLGRALDLYVYAALVSPATDPILVERVGDSRYWRLWLRVARGCGQVRELHPWVAPSRGKPRESSPIEVEVQDLTDLFARHGFDPIPARSSFFKGGNRGGAEFWHLQWSQGLERGKSTFGEELLKAWPRSRIEGTLAWRHRDAVWNGIGWS